MGDEIIAHEESHENPVINDIFNIIEGKVFHVLELVINILPKMTYLMFTYLNIFLFLYCNYLYFTFCCCPDSLKLEFRFGDW